MAAPLRLAEVQGASYLVHVVELEAPQRQRLAELGIRVGMAVSVLQHTSGGGIVVGAGGSRVALDRRTADRILVEPAA